MRENVLLLLFLGKYSALRINSTVWSVTDSFKTYLNSDDNRKGKKVRFFALTPRSFKLFADNKLSHEPEICGSGLALKEIINNATDESLSNELFQKGTVLRLFAFQRLRTVILKR